jgi:plasmid stabilization system protein ParE
MKQNFRLTEDARQDLFEIARHIANDNLTAAGRFLEFFEHACDMLSDLPEMGSIPEAFSRSSMKETRTFPVKHFANYLIFYRPLAGKRIEIIRIVHGARDLPVLFGVSMEENENGEKN